jgi:ATP/maltotriose-dependent transcriptional regulator MalT
MMVEIIHFGPACIVSPSHLFVANGRMLVGRSTHCQLVIDDLSVSRKHAEIVRHHERVTLKDLESTNGTYVNNHRVHTCELHHGMRIQFAKIGFLLNMTETRSGLWGSDLDTDDCQSELSAAKRLHDILRFQNVHLSDSELHVLDLLAQAMPDKEIAHQLSVSLRTVQTHNQAIYKKMRVHSRTQLLCRLTEMMPQEESTDELPCDPDPGRSSSSKK